MEAKGIKMEKQVLKLHENCISIVDTIAEETRLLDSMIERLPTDNIYAQSHAPYLTSKKKDCKRFERTNSGRK
jgi:hypothetical protein